MPIVRAQQYGKACCNTQESLSDTSQVSGRNAVKEQMNSCHHLNKVTTDTDTETVYQNTTASGTVSATKSADSDMAVLTLQHRETNMREKS